MCVVSLGSVVQIRFSGLFFILFYFIFKYFIFIFIRHDESIIDYNAPPASQPSLWCHWRPSESKQALEWSGAEKFYNSVLWLEYMIEKFFKPWGIVLNGQVVFQGEAKKDVRVLILKIILYYTAKRSFFLAWLYQYH